MDNTDLTRKDYARELGINIARARTAKEYSQDGVAADTGLSRFTYWKLERGDQTLTPPPTSDYAASSPSPMHLTSNLPTCFPNTLDLRRQ
ncbi:MULTISPECIES: helix-turn-helix domain-containing protein [Bifidobacterium]|uniref:helix-turn-helix domain-containing protein n=1 Tax=Bifidobacterium TaxID=1678 RepID=UPI0018DE437A|nr:MULTISPECIES: helix-turn-helix domain-containing protein [Bifidobacterium]MBH9981046.1 helix-turn-helix domain-containing protein [Bifidobacterium asteroides]MBI0100216.1 helix-turn-helix domain-containing protein [Bifidobacterium sp. W8114]